MREIMDLLDKRNLDKLPINILKNILNNWDNILIQLI